MNAKETAISPSRVENYPEWYQSVIKAAELAENSPVRGCMVIKPWGYGIWELMQRHLDGAIKATGHENAYFPLFIPLSFLEKEASHIEGFAKECAVVTHHRLEMKNGKLIPTGELEEPYVVRPTSETIIGDSFSKWVQSYRDLPLLINQWANVVRWEMRPRLFLRTAEFLWQEGHTVHEDEADARREVDQMLEVYRAFVEDVLAIPVIPGRKPDYDRFPGAIDTLCIEAMMQDGKALQAGTSHYLGQNFAKASDIRFLDREGIRQYAHTTSWGASTRLIGGLIMTHSDDDGLRVPPRVAPKHIVILPVIPKEESRAAVMEYIHEIAVRLRAITYDGFPLVVHVDNRDIRGGEKSWQWIKKGIPLRLEVGPKDLESKKGVLYRRDQGVKEKIPLAIDDLISQVPSILSEMQKNYYDQAKTYLQQRTETLIKTFEELSEYFSQEGNFQKGGFVVGKWSGSSETEAKLAPLKVTIRCLPLQQSGTEGKCLITGEPATTDAIFAKAY